MIKLNISNKNDNNKDNNDNGDDNKAGKKNFDPKIILTQN